MKFRMASAIPAFARTSAGQRDIREAIGPTYSALEEAYDIVGLYGLKWLVYQAIFQKTNR